MALCASAQHEAPAYVLDACPAYVAQFAGNGGSDMRCGVLFVPEERDAAATHRFVELFVIDIPARQPAGNAPIVYVSGGPGEAVINDLAAIVASPFHQHFRFIAMDQRGAGLSLPSLNCPEAADPAASADEWIRACYQRLSGEGIALRATHSATHARDIHDLLLALEIDEAHVYGQSYGSRLALTLARDYPERVRTLILDAVLPLQVNRWNAYAPNANRALQQLLGDCAADAACHEAYPQLRASLLTALRKLNSDPAVIQLEGKQALLMKTGDDFVIELLTMLYDTRLIPYLPALIDAYARGQYNYDPRLDAKRRAADPPPTADDIRGHADHFSEGTQLSVLCAEEAPFNSRADIVNRAAGIAALVRRPLVAQALDALAACALWPVPSAQPLENEPVASDIPTLLLSGAYDPVTPPAWGAEAAAFLRNSWHIVLPDVGHGALFASACAETITLSFLDAPLLKPDNDCLAEGSAPSFFVRQ